MPSKAETNGTKGTVLSLFDFSGVMVKPWRDDGYTTLQVDWKHPDGVHILHDGAVVWGSDVLDIWKELFFIQPTPKIIFSFPPCTDLASSGARWWARKRQENPDFQEEAMKLVYLARTFGKFHNIPWMVENPIGKVSTLWRKSDYIFHPWQYSGYESGDTYNKRTCLWVGNGFVMPKENVHKNVLSGETEIDDRIHRAPESSHRYRRRNTTPAGFAHAVWLANKDIV